jgi:hypothetical protein
MIKLDHELAPLARDMIDQVCNISNSLFGAAFYSFHPTKKKRKTVYLERKQKTKNKKI